MKKHGLSAVFTVTIAALALQSPQALAEQVLNVAVGNAIHPWVIPQSNNGITIDILKKTLEPAGYKVNPVYYPYQRRITTYNDGKVDVVTDVNSALIKAENLKGYPSGVAYSFNNVAVALKKNGFKVASLDDLTTHSMVAWQGAKDIIGGKYAEMANNNKGYSEIPDQGKQLLMLYSGRTQFIQLDEQILKYYLKQAVGSQNADVDFKQPVDIFPVFGGNPMGYLFKDQKVQVTFDENLKKIQQNGEYDKIFKQYTE